MRPVDFFGDQAEAKLVEYRQLKIRPIYCRIAGFRGVRKPFWRLSWAQILYAERGSHMQLRPMIVALALGLALGGCANQVVLERIGGYADLPTVAELRADIGAIRQG